MTCKDCIHYEACAFFTAMCDINKMFVKGRCGYFEDKSLFIELPCKIGDKVYEITILCHNPSDYCSRKTMKNPCKHCEWHYGTIRSEILGTTITIDRTIQNWGKTVFFTREEAEKALAERGTK